MTGSRDPSKAVQTVGSFQSAPQDGPFGADGDGDPAALARTIRRCRLCVSAPVDAPLPHEPRPILVLSRAARLVIASQAPGLRAHRSGVPFDDASGARLRAWMGIGEHLFYDPDKVMIVPMGFCFPGYDANGGDRPPRRECRPAWHDTVFAQLPQVETILAIGLHAIRYHRARLHHATSRDLGLVDHVLGNDPPQQLGAGPRLIALPHPSWRNSGWLKRHPRFETEVLPAVRAEVERLVG